MAKFSRPETFRREAERKSASSGTNIRFPDKPNPHSMLMVFKEYDFKNYEPGVYANPLYNKKITDEGIRTSGVGLRSLNSIELPFPKQLTDNTALNINNQTRDPLIEKGAEVASNFVNGNSTLSDLPGQLQSAGAIAGNKFNELMKGGGGNAGDLVKGVFGAAGGVKQADVASAAGYLLRQAGSALGVGTGAVDLVTGQTLNPKETLAFQGVQLRTHQFNWDLYPSNRADTSQIKAIIDTLKKNALPRITGFNESFNDVFLSFPHVVEIYLLGVNQEYFPVFKPAMITNISVDYGAGGNLAIMKGGAPAGVSISLSLMELEIQTAEDLEYPESDYVDSNISDDGASALDQSVIDRQIQPNMSIYDLGSDPTTRTT